MCGEKSLVCHAEVVLHGSPPRVRGKGIAGLIINPSQPDHPRVCGEKHVCDLECHGNRGSPPRVRGKDKTKKLRRDLVGITPACAGKRFAEEMGLSSGGDHPRVCGEKQNAKEVNENSKGSPPRVRGKALR